MADSVQFERLLRPYLDEILTGRRLCLSRTRRLDAPRGTLSLSHTRSRLLPGARVDHRRRDEF